MGGGEWRISAQAEEQSGRLGERWSGVDLVPFAVDQLRPRLASHLSTRQSLHSPRNESLVYAQWFHQVSTTKKGGAIDDALALRTTRG